MNDEESDVVEFKLAPENEQFHIGDYVRLKLWVVLVTELLTPSVTG